MNYQFRILDEQDVYDGFFHLRRYELNIELFRGGFSQSVVRECSTTTGYVVAALPYDPVRKEIVLVEQFRVGAMVAGVHPWQCEIVAGFMDKAGETPEECVQRELLEEIGTTATKLELVDTYFTGPGGSAGQVHLFFAEIDSSLVSKHAGLLAEGEDILVHRLPYETVLQQLAQGEISNATMILAVQAFILRKIQPQFLLQWQ